MPPIGAAPVGAVPDEKAAAKARTSKVKKGSGGTVRLTGSKNSPPPSPGLSAFANIVSTSPGLGMSPGLSLSPGLVTPGLLSPGLITSGPNNFKWDVGVLSGGVLTTSTTNLEDDFESQKHLASRLLDMLDENSILALARDLQGRGFLNEFNLGHDLASTSVVAPPGPLAPSGSVAPTGLQGVKNIPFPPGQWQSNADPETSERKDHKSTSVTSQEELAQKDLRSSENEGQDTSNDGKVTSLIIRNLPAHFNQESTMAWLDEQGYHNLYDFLLWFPAKKMARHNTASVFVNFRSDEDAARFRKAFHSLRMPCQDTQKPNQGLNISVAKVQGFVENFIRFWHLTTEDSKAVSRCRPFFAEDSSSVITPEQMEEAKAAGQAANHSADKDAEWNATTVIIRNLPPHVETQSLAMEWLSNTAHGHGYDFFLFVPHKRTGNKMLSDALSANQNLGLAYIFINYRKPELAKACVLDLDGKVLLEGDPCLSVVSSRIQGLEDCKKHFRDLADSGRLVPWIAEAPAERGKSAAAKVFARAAKDAAKSTASTDVGSELSLGSFRYQ